MSRKLPDRPISVEFDEPPLEALVEPNMSVPRMKAVLLHIREEFRADKALSDLAPFLTHITDELDYRRQLAISVANESAATGMGTPPNKKH